MPRSLCSLTHSLLIALQLLQASPAGGSCGPTASISASEPDAQCYLSMSSAYASARDAPPTCGVPASVHGYLKNSVSSVSQSMLNNINATNFVPVTGRAALVHEHAISNPLHSVFEDLERFAKPVLVSLAALRGLDMGNNKLSSTDTKPDESWLTRQRQPSKLKIDSIKSGVDIPKTLSKKVLLSMGPQEFWWYRAPRQIFMIPESAGFFGRVWLPPKDPRRFSKMVSAEPSTNIRLIELPMGDRRDARLSVVTLILDLNPCHCNFYPNKGTRHRHAAVIVGIIALLIKYGMISLPLDPPRHRFQQTECSEIPATVSRRLCSCRVIAVVLE
ncbi:hypothetical protein C8R45DRAFT_931762 [Mycena sanguinolenta]|nr:hypothetical protein C8R45DRAFT_931762 [Mycena sanguinolenta]